MRFKEFLGAYDAPFAEEAVRRQVFEEVLPLLLIEEDGGFDSGPPPSVPDGQTEPAPTNPPPVRPGFGGGHWINQLYVVVKQYAVASRISSRLKKLGIKGVGVDRVNSAKSTALKHVKLLLNNPGSTAYRIPVWTTKAPPKPVIKVWNEAMTQALAAELGLLSEDQVSDLALKTAAAFLETGIDDMELTSRSVDSDVTEQGKIVKRKVVKAADAQWHVIHYKHRNKDYARIEGPEGNKMYQVTVKTGPAKLT